MDTFFSKKSPRPLRFIILIGLGVIAIAAISRVRAAKEIIPWRTNFADARKEADGSRKPLMLYFTAEWCGPCQSLRSTTWASKEVEKALREYVPVKIDIDEHPDLARQYVANSIPRFVVVDSGGTIVKAADGALPPEDFIQWLTQ